MKIDGSICEGSCKRFCDPYLHLVTCW